MSEPSPHDLAERLARLEERMKTMQAEYKTDIALLAKQNSERDTRLILAVLGMIALAVAILKFA